MNEWKRYAETLPGPYESSIVKPIDWLRLDNEDKPTFVAIAELIAITVTDRDARAGLVNVTVVLRGGQTAAGWMRESLLL